MAARCYVHGETAQAASPRAGQAVAEGDTQLRLGTISDNKTSLNRPDWARWGVLDKRQYVPHLRQRSLRWRFFHWDSEHWLW